RYCSKNLGCTPSYNGRPHVDRWAILRERRRRLLMASRFESLMTVIRQVQGGVRMDSTTRALLVALGILLVVALGFSALMGGVMGPGIAGQGPVGPTMMPGHGWMWGLGMGFGGLVMLTFWGALIVGIVLLVRSMGVGGGP